MNTPEQFALAALVAAGHVSQTTVDKALALYPGAALTQGAGEAVEPVAWMVWWGVCDMRPSWPPYKTRAEAEDHASTIKSVTEVRPLSAAPPAQQLQQAVAREREKWTAIADRLLAHCGEGECPTCSEIICPHGDTMHFHHDGCPTCEQEAALIRTKGTHQ